MRQFQQLKQMDEIQQKIEEQMSQRNAEKAKDLSKGMVQAGIHMDRGSESGVYTLPNEFRLKYMHGLAARTKFAAKVPLFPNIAARSIPGIW